jgi:hypothetical protein
MDQYRIQASVLSFGDLHNALAQFPKLRERIRRSGPR